VRNALLPLLRSWKLERAPCLASRKFKLVKSHKSLEVCIFSDDVEIIVVSLFMLTNFKRKLAGCQGRPTGNRVIVGIPSFNLFVTIST